MLYKNKIDKILYDNKKDLEINIIQFPEQFKKIGDLSYMTKEQFFPRNIKDSMKRIGEIHEVINKTYIDNLDKKEGFEEKLPSTTRSQKNLNKGLTLYLKNKFNESPPVTRNSLNPLTTKTTAETLNRKMSYFNNYKQNRTDRNFYFHSPSEFKATRVHTLESTKTNVFTNSTPRTKINTPANNSLQKIQCITTNNSSKILNTEKKSKQPFMKVLNKEINEISTVNSSLIKNIKKTKKNLRYKMVKDDSNKELKELVKIDIPKGVFVTRNNGKKVYVGEKNNVFTQINLVKYMSEDCAYKSRMNLIKTFKLTLQQNDIIYSKPSTKTLINKLDNNVMEKEQKLMCLYTANKSLANVLKEKLK